MTMLVLPLSCMMIGLLSFDLAAVRDEPNLERRSERALDNAGSALHELSQAYASGDIEKTKSEASEIEASVTLAYESLVGTGKDPRRNPKAFKHAELTTRELLRHIDGAIEAMSVDDRALLTTVRERVSEIHDELLNGIMKKKP
jgi:hypothetical protein